MRLKLDVEIPQWTQWLASGIAIGVIIGVGAARVYADTITVKSDWQPGQPLNAADLNNAFKALQDELNRQKHPDCPEDYSKDATERRFVVCKKGVDQVVKVGDGGSAFWIDRYEAGIYVDAAATGTQYGVPNGPAFPAVFPENGEYPDGDNDVNTPPFYLYAVSLAGRPPSASTTWFQAQAACRLSGKRLPTGEEWLAASVGTKDPKAPSAGENGTCVTATALRNTGGGTACVSVWGAEDMIGNVWEATIDWYAGVGTATGADYGPKPWTGAAYNGDGTWGVVSSAMDANNVAQPGLPAPGLRGGSRLNGTSAGRFALAAVDAPSRPVDVYGFRCVTPR